MGGSEREKVKRKVSKGKGKSMVRVVSGTPPRATTPFGRHDRRRLLQALRDCAEAVDAAGPGGNVPDRVKMEGLLRCLTHSINLLEKDALYNQPERQYSSSGLETDQVSPPSRHRQRPRSLTQAKTTSRKLLFSGPSSSRDSSLICRGPNLNSALTSINLENVSRRTISAHNIKRINILEKSSSSTICGDRDNENKYCFKNQSTGPNGNEHDGDESSNCELSSTTSSLPNSQRTVLHFEPKSQRDLVVRETYALESDVQIVTDPWFSSHSPSPSFPRSHLFTNSSLNQEIVGESKACTESEGNTSQDEISLSQLDGISFSTRGAKGKRMALSESVSPRYCFSAKKEDVSVKALRKSAPQERTAPFNKKVGRERSVYTVRKRDPLNSSHKKRCSPREGDNSRTIGREKSLKEYMRDGLHTMRAGLTDNKPEKLLEVISSKTSQAQMHKSANARQADRRIKTAESTSSKRTVRRRPISRSSVNKGKLNLEYPQFKSPEGLISIPIQVKDIDNIQEKPENEEKERKQKEVEKPHYSGVSEKLKINVTPTISEQEEKLEPMTARKRGSGKRAAKSRKSKTKDKLKTASAQKKANFYILPNSAPSKKEDRLLVLEKSRSLSKINNQLIKSNSESRFTLTPKKHLKNSPELINTLPTKAQGYPPRLTSSERRLERKSEKRTYAMDKQSSRSSIRCEELQTHVSSSLIHKANSRTSESKGERKSPTSTSKRTLKRRHSGPYLNKNGSKSAPLSSKRSQTRTSARSSKTSYDGSPPSSRYMDNLNKPQNRAAKSKSSGKLLIDLSRGSQRSPNGSPISNETKKLHLRKSNSGALDKKCVLDKSCSVNTVPKEEKLKSATIRQLMGMAPKSASFNTVPKEEKHKSTTVRQLMGIISKSASFNTVPKEENHKSAAMKQLIGSIPKSASYTETAADESNHTTTLTQEMANDFRKLLKQKTNFGKDPRGISPPEKFSASDLRQLLIQSATKKKKVTFACFDQLQPPCVRRLKTDYIDKAQKNASKPSDYTKLKGFPNSHCSPTSSPPNEVKRLNVNIKTKTCLPDGKERVSLPSVSKQVKSILSTANKGFTREEFRQTPLISLTTETRAIIRSPTGEPKSHTNDGPKVRCIPHILTRYMESTDNDDFSTKMGQPLYSPNSSNIQPLPLTYTYGIQNNIDNRLIKTKSQNFLHGQP